MEELSARDRGTLIENTVLHIKVVTKRNRIRKDARKSPELYGPRAGLFRPWNMISFMQILWVRACVRDICVAENATLCKPIKVDKKKVN